MRLNYTLPGSLPEAPSGPPVEAGDHPAAAPFHAHLPLLSAPRLTDWRKLLRLNTPPTGLAGIGPPQPPRGIDLRDGASQRAWWRGMIQKHSALLDPAGGEEPSQGHANVDPRVRRMLGWLTESQQREEEIFARHFAQAED